MQSTTTMRHGPFDIVGDVHGCFEELTELMRALGYQAEQSAGGFEVTAPPGRTLAFVGDLVNRGPQTAQVLRLVMSMAGAGQALCVAGNHEVRLLKALRGGATEKPLDLKQSIEQLAQQPVEFRAKAVAFLEGLASHLVLDAGRLVIAHAGLKEHMQGSDSAQARAFALNGETTSERDAAGVPIRANWAAEYRGRALVVYGHTPFAEPVWLNNTVNIDTGCVYGGRLTALRYPERETASVPARAPYYPSRRDFLKDKAPTPKDGKVERP